MPSGGGEDRPATQKHLMLHPSLRLVVEHPKVASIRTCGYGSEHLSCEKKWVRSRV